MSVNSEGGKAKKMSMCLCLCECVREREREGGNKIFSVISLM